MLNHKDSKDLILIEFPEMVKEKKNFAQITSLLAAETNDAMKWGVVERAKQVLNFTHYLFLHSNKYVQLLLLDQYYKKLNCVRCNLSFQNFTRNHSGAGGNESQLPFHISYRLRNAKSVMQLTLITIK
ncbi:hypothetical protein C7S20_07780 [Christiangramia fulva]|uniref:Uncharacterized protein n=1 Tax=Christiangramia fulva TaxID=2126553 RepID=A0A2R3Z4I0_9FLAO|nr:hypothetical protein [Christiangramia fulva]AVR45180.1 hypothetical protein C7S20_07780 [Christiangramia fulva]